MDHSTRIARDSKVAPNPGQSSFLDDATGPQVSPTDPAAIPTQSPESEAPNPFDPARYRLSTNYAEMVGTQSHLLEVPVRKPSKETWFRVHPTNRLETAILEVGEDGGDRETFLVDPSLWSSLAMETTFGPRLLIHYVTRTGVTALWPIKLPRDGEKLNPWTRSALQAVTLAETRWIRLQSDRNAGAYVAQSAPGITDEPTWPDYPFPKLLELAFQDKLITSPDHPILKRLRGEV